MKKGLALLLALALTVSCVPIAAFAETEAEDAAPALLVGAAPDAASLGVAEPAPDAIGTETPSEPAQEAAPGNPYVISAEEIEQLLNQISYEEYLARYETAARPEQEIALDVTAFVKASDDVRKDALGDDKRPAVVTGEEGSVVWEVEVPAAGLYQMKVAYYPIKGKDGMIERKILINDEVPFEGADVVQFSRIWDNGAEVIRDQRDNDVRPTQVETPMWRETFVRDSEGFEDQPYWFYFREGVNTITFTAVQEPLAIGGITLTQTDEIPTYEQLAADYAAKGYTDATEAVETIKVQAENALNKSSSTLYPNTDRSSPLSEDHAGQLNHASKTRINTVGGEEWNTVGQWITWEFEVSESALYEISMRYRQNVTSGQTSLRSLQIDGAYPCKEVMELPYSYKNSWQGMTVGDAAGNPYKFYLEKGTHTVTMEVVLGEEMGEMLRRIEDSILQLNAAYRELLVIIGSTADTLRDYQLQLKAPGALKKLQEQLDELQDVYTQMKAYYSGSGGMDYSALDQLIIQLERMCKKPDDIAKWWGGFKDSIISLSSWELARKEQPLELDYLLIHAPSAKLPRFTASFWQKMVHETKAFFASFIEDYTSLGEVYNEEGGSAGKVVTVWSQSGASGRDQAQLIKNMLDNDFVLDSGISVNLQLVSSGVLLSASLAGRGPDVALHCASGDPVQYALRNAVADLTQFDDFYEYMDENFYEEAMVPFRLTDENGHTGYYAIPETMSFLMMFYRADVLAELGVEVPTTWDEFFEAVAVIQKNNMNVGLPVDILSYSMLLMQSGGTLYNEEGTASALDSDAAIHAFEKWTSLFSEYGLPVNFNFGNRFRTGEMPIGIADYTQFTYLSVFAPEIKGLWGFTLVPGTKHTAADGTEYVDHTAPVSVSSTILMESSEVKPEAWAFMKWWMSGDVQTSYGNQLENILGVAGRLATANKDALTKLSWSSRNVTILNRQLEEIAGIPEIPGGYYLSRHITNAFWSVYNNNGNPRETLDEYVLTINEEITKKRKEFGLKTTESEDGTSEE